ncbi:uncharacterized protein SI:DKEY-16J16.4 isoform X2 [Latimeria chalumnae]|uniref:uncharacterized protein SI:DKEY-16J16.4 isoform X2 n=1 Tax=Latimeria chalumnae TaxID=7897 RepID=UPI00313D7214
MLKIVTKKLRNQSIDEIQPFQLKISCSPSDEDDSEDSEGENQELVQIDKERRWNSSLTPLGTNQLQNQEAQHLCKVRALFHPGSDRHSSEEELDLINRDFAAEKRKWSAVNRLGCHSNCNTPSSDEEVKDLCGMTFRPVEQADCLCASSSPVLFSASPPKRLQPLVRGPGGPIIVTSVVGTGFDQASPCKRHRQGGFRDDANRPSLDFEKMQQSVNNNRPPPRYLYDPSTFAFRSLSTLKPISPMTAMEEPPCAF